MSKKERDIILDKIYELRLESKSTETWTALTTLRNFIEKFGLKIKNEKRS